MANVIYILKKYNFLFIGAIVLEVIILTMTYLGSNKTINYLVLSGDDIVNIYKGTSYIETGYMAYNSDNEDLNNMVVVSNERLNFLNNQWLTILPQFSDFEITAVPIKVEGLSYEDGSISNADRELIEKAVTDNLEQNFYHQYIFGWQFFHDYHG